MIKELTCGSFGKIIWYRWCFNISLDESTIIIEVPFNKKTIPIERIKKLESVKGFLTPKHFKLTYEDGNQVIKFIRFFSGSPSAWFNELQNRGVKIEDAEGLRNLKDDRFFWFAKWLNLTAGIAGAIAAAIALIVVFYAFVTGKF